MGIHFPEVKEIKLKNPPISEVICQVKFPPILKIGKELPINFQDVVRPVFPGIDIEQGVQIQMGVSPAEEKPLIDASPKIFRFKSPDGKQAVSLSIDFFALSSKQYTGWVDFSEKLSFVKSAFLKEFNPSFVSRIGLRFINRFNLENVGADNFEEVLDLFRSDLTCLIRSNTWSDPVESLSQIVLSNENRKLVFRYGMRRENQNPFFILDFDCFEEFQQDFSDISNKINEYHDVIYSAFRWCLKEKSLEKFQPVGEI